MLKVRVAKNIRGEFHPICHRRTSLILMVCSSPLS
jgi:hypothetical protein